MLYPSLEQPSSGALPPFYGHKVYGRRDGAACDTIPTVWPWCACCWFEKMYSVVDICGKKGNVRVYICGYLRGNVLENETLNDGKMKRPVGFLIGNALSRCRFFVVVRLLCDAIFGN